MVARSLTLSWLAALMLIASPAIGGQLLPLVHPCAAEAAESGSHAGHGAGHDQSPGAAQCSCLGSCQASAIVAMPQAVTVAVADLGHAVEVRLEPRGEVVHRLDRPIDRLPPPTAPPLA